MPETTSTPEAETVLPKVPDESEALRDLVLAVPGVVRLDGGRFGEIATYLPGRRVVGIRRFDDGSAEVHVVAHLGADLPQLADRVHAVLREHTGQPGHVVIADLAR